MLQSRTVPLGFESAGRVVKGCNVVVLLTKKHSSMSVFFDMEWALINSTKEIALKLSDMMENMKLHGICPRTPTITAFASSSFLISPQHQFDSRHLEETPSKKHGQHLKRCRKGSIHFEREKAVKTMRERCCDDTVGGEYCAVSILFGFSEDDDIERPLWMVPAAYTAINAGIGGVRAAGVSFAVLGTE
ncbi:hypothetical protein AAG906_032571 [Vitis piasezkii]